MEREKGVTVGVPEDMVLNGIFDKVFQHPSYEFDKEYGSFVVQKLLDKSISTRVQHPGSLMARWTTKALTRRGFRISSGAPVELMVNEERRCWIISHEGESVETYSIGEALQQISRFMEN